MGYILNGLYNIYNKIINMTDVKPMKKQQLSEEFKRMQKLAGLINENEKNDFDINIAFNESPNEHSYEDMLNVVKDYEDEKYLNSFISTFPEGEPINKEKWIEWSRSISDYDPEGYTLLNWISLTDPDIYRKAGVL